MLPGQENNQSRARCWKDVAATVFFIFYQPFGSKPLFSTLKAIWFGQRLRNFGLQQPFFSSFLHWVSPWFPCLFAGRWCHPVSEKHCACCTDHLQDMENVFLNGANFKLETQRDIFVSVNNNLCIQHFMTNTFLSPSQTNNKIK